MDGYYTVALNIMGASLMWYYIICISASFVWSGLPFSTSSSYSKAQHIYILLCHHIACIKEYEGEFQLQPWMNHPQAYLRPTMGKYIFLRESREIIMLRPYIFYTYE